jgi:hypothetical protein
MGAAAPEGPPATLVTMPILPSIPRADRAEGPLGARKRYTLKSTRAYP